MYPTVPFRMSLTAPAAPEAMESGRALPAGPAGRGVPYVLSCALAQGFLPALEEALRETREQSQTARRRMVTMVDLALRRPGCWPSMLAYGDARQVG